MKTTNILISTALVALATTSFGQPGSIKERLFPNRTEQVQFLTAEYVAESNPPENRGFDLYDRFNSNNDDEYEAPVVSRTIYTSNVEVIYESEIGLESWMALPFENIVTEEEMYLESWMTAPFDETVYEEELSLESWMIAPFEAEPAQDEIRLESWMSAPFESTVAEEVLFLEEWMIAAIWQ